MQYEEIIQKTWNNEAFKNELMNDPKTVLGLDGNVEVKVFDDSADKLHFVLLSESQYGQASIDDNSIIGQVTRRAHEDASFKARLLTDANSAVQEVAGIEAPAAIEIHENTASVLNIVLPANPEATGELSDTDLSMVAGGKGLELNCTTISSGLNKAGGLMDTVGSLLPGNFGGLFSSMGPLLTGGGNITTSVSNFLGNFVS